MSTLRFALSINLGSSVILLIQSDMNTSMEKESRLQRTKLVNDDGSINLIDYEIDGKRATIVGTDSGGRGGKVSQAIDEGRFEDGTRKTYTRGELCILQRDGHI